MVWRARNDGLPTMLNLFQKHVITDSACYFCKATEEDLAHALVVCPSIWSSWISYFPAMNKLNPSMYFMEMAIQVNELSDLEALELFFLLAWTFWHRRNRWIHEHDCSDPRVSIAHALSMHKYYKESFPTPSSLLRRIGQWKRPPDDFLKLNVDGGIVF